MWEFIDTKQFHDHLNSLRWLQNAASWLRWTAVGAPTWCFSTISWHNESWCFLVSLKPSENSYIQEFEFIVLMTLLDHGLHSENQLPSCDITIPDIKLSFQILILCFCQKVCHDTISSNACCQVVWSNPAWVGWPPTKTPSFWLPTGARNSEERRSDCLPKESLGCDGVFWGPRGVIRRVWCFNRRGLDC